MTLQFFCIRSNISPKLLEPETSNLVGGFVLGMPSRRTNNFSESGRGLDHVTPTIFGSTVGCPSDSLASCLAGYNLSLFPISSTLAGHYRYTNDDADVYRELKCLFTGTNILIRRFARCL